MTEGAEASPHNKNPQLLQHKPSKAQVKKAKASAPPPLSSRPMASSLSSGPGPPLPATTQKRSFIRRMVPFLLAANLAVGAYVLTRTTNKKPAEESEHAEEAPAAPVTKEVIAETKSTPETPPAQLPAPAVVKVLSPVPKDEQRKLFNWILEEKRRIKASDKSEKKKIDEEKALLKRYIRGESFPSF